MIEYFQAAFPVVALIINMLGQLLIARMFPRGKFLQSVVAGFGAGFIGLVALAVSAHLLRSDPWEEAGAIMVVDIGAYTALSYCFFCFINLSKTSLRLMIFKELQKAPSGLSMKEILALYNFHKIVELRLNRLVKKKHVVNRDGRYFLRGFLLWFIAKVVQGAKILVMGKESEFS
jgi:hypothetical protein